MGKTAGVNADRAAVAREACCAGPCRSPCAANRGQFRTAAAACRAAAPGTVVRARPPPRPSRRRRAPARCARANHHEKRLLNGIIDPQTAKGDATRLAIIHPTAAAAVVWDVMLCARIAERQLTPATAAAEQARQQSVAVLGC